MKFNKKYMVGVTPKCKSQEQPVWVSLVLFATSYCSIICYYIISFDIKFTLSIIQLVIKSHISGIKHPCQTEIGVNQEEIWLQVMNGALNVLSHWFMDCIHSSNKSQEHRGLNYHIALVEVRACIVKDDSLWDL